ncbi:DUF305 domain-containing protein [Brevundimonas sp.]|uniref:DUF305 domain-containing protein n=1 Tax=Brevundimonas sp. TaxID=1871086 RepID=UPI002B721F38|nr:DUF305 domain-containing protein [Brevundimonas sp.]HWQ86299.1 DUF305 domain-containing protein [Brevundimonas sp.]
MRRVAILLPAALALTACEGGGDPVQQALRETAAANQSATVRETATTSATDPASMDRTWVAGMIEHHRNGAAMADAALVRSQDPQVRRMAQAIKTARTREIAEMQAWEPAAAAVP